MITCTYCNKSAVATREHVIPAFIYRFQKELEKKVIGWNEAAQKMTGGEFQVKDVCEKCNGGVLSQLDSYGKDFLTSSGFLVQNYTSLTSDLTYNYDLLSRWLLKISFNSSRTDGDHKHLFEKFTPYILTGTPLPLKNDISIIAALAAPIKTQNLNDEYDVLRDLAGASGRVNPFFMRIAYGPDYYKAFTLRIVMFGPLIFFLLMFRPGTPVGISANETKKFLKETPKTLLLQRNRPRVFLEAGSTTWLEYYAPQVWRLNALDPKGR
jgi:hypothetical protein